MDMTMAHAIDAVEQEGLVQTSHAVDVKEVVELAMAIHVVIVEFVNAVVNAHSLENATPAMEAVNSKKAKTATFAKAQAVIK
mmetsp:Transcript_44309/g.73318  ORF Transcript_44309/g.73318 Transcript_44309/m.73318 type:complete len:82 (+) Transcript_44309:17-262(+)